MGRTINAAMRQEKLNGNEERVEYAQKYKSAVEVELGKLCDQVLALLEDAILLAQKPSTKIRCCRLKADMFRYIAESADGVRKIHAVMSARDEYQKCVDEAKSKLKPIHV